MSLPDPALIDAVWQHGRVMPEMDASAWRQDACGADRSGVPAEKYARPPRNRSAP